MPKYVEIPYMITKLISNLNILTDYIMSNKVVAYTVATTL